MRVGVIRIVRDGQKYFLFSFFLSAFLACGNAQIIVSRGAVWINLNRFVQFGEGIVELGLPIINNAERGMRKLVLGRNRHSLFQRQLRRPKFAAAKINHAEIGKRVKVIGTFGQDFLILFFGRLIFALLEALFGRVRNILEIIWHVRFELGGTIRRRTAFARGSFLCFRFRDLHGVRRRFFGKDKTRF